MKVLMNEKSKDKYGNRFWSLFDYEDFHLKCTYNSEIEIQDYYINGLKVDQDSLIVELADLYETQSEQDIKDNIQADLAHEDFIEAHQIRLRG